MLKINDLNPGDTLNSMTILTWEPDFKMDSEVALMWIGNFYPKAAIYVVKDGSGEIAFLTAENRPMKDWSNGIAIVVAAQGEAVRAIFKWNREFIFVKCPLDWEAEEKAVIRYGSGIFS